MEAGSLKNTLFVYLPQLPKLDAKRRWDTDLLRFNCESRLLDFEGDKVNPTVLDSCSLTQDGLVYRIQIKRPYVDKKLLSVEDIIYSLSELASCSVQGTLLKNCLKHPQDIKRSFKQISKYRFEIHFREKVPEIMSILSTVESSIHGENHKYHSGPWKIAEIKKQSIQLNLNEAHPRSHESMFQSVIIKPSTAFSKHPSDAAFVTCGPGFTHRQSLRHYLSDTEHHSLDFYFSFFFVLFSDDTGISQRFKKACHRFMKKPSPWKRSIMTGFSDETSPYHVAFRPLISREHDSSYKKLKIHLALEFDLPKELLDGLRSSLLDENLEVIFTNSPDQSDGALYSMDSFSHIESSSFISRILDTFESNRLSSYFDYTNLKKSAKEADKRRRTAKLKLFVSEISQNPQFIPLLTTALCLNSNRYIEIRDRTGLDFLSVKSSIQEIENENAREASLRAIGSAVQMFTHDVKKPFSMIKSFINLISQTTDPMKIKSLSEKHLPQIDKIVGRVEGLISDIAEVGVESKVYKEPKSIHDILRESISEVAVQFDGKHQKLETSLRHRYMVDVDFYKMQRVFVNILSNAFQAAPKDAKVWIRTWDKDDKLKVVIGNSGSFIPKEKIKKIFESFYTEGKRHGTGLGLAIAKKIILAHDGNIECFSSKESGTEFIISIPCLALPDEPDKQSDFKAHHELDIKSADQPLRAIIADDSEAYLEITRDLLEAMSEPKVEASFTNSVKSLLSLVSEAPLAYDLILVDIHFGDNSPDGFQAIDALRKLGTKAVICLHSDASMLSFQRRALEEGADIFLPKPLSSVHIQQLWRSIFSQEILTPSRKRFGDKLWIVDDDAFYLEIWQEYQSDAEVFSTPADTLAALEDAVELPKVIVIDYVFKNSPMDGPSLAKKIRNRFGTSILLFLCTDMKTDIADTVFTGQLPKDHKAALAALSRYI
ncbi:MAG: response regulator [Pseudobacteriovorax sp.]|nr:response regulator [Pseudobacteriovorax sp.]